MHPTKFLGIGLSLSLLTLLGLGQVESQEDGGETKDAVARGEYVVRAAGGCTCHSNPNLEDFSLSGGRPIKTPFGIIYGTNITPDPETGIGAFSEQDFIKAMREGVGPDGKVYYPVFPYTSFTKMTDQDVSDMKAYLDSLPPVKNANKPPEFRFPYSNRSTVSIWRGLHFDPERFTPTAGKSAQWNRGAYLSEALAHCGECHTPRTFMGASDDDLYYAGSVEGPEGELAPNITPHEETGIGTWGSADITWFLQWGLKPDGDDTQGLMKEVIDHGYQHLDADDIEAMAVYLQSLAPIDNEVRPQQ